MAAIHPSTKQTLRRAEKSLPPAIGMKADDVVREEPFVHGDAHLLR